MHVQASCCCSLLLSLQWAFDLQRLLGLEEREGNGLRREQGRSQATGGRE